jgi:putative spermidine/putrescine transport system substrate-binding protein
MRNRYKPALLALVLGMTSLTAQADEVVFAGTGGASQKAAHEAFVVPFSARTGIKVIEDEYDQKLSQVQAQVETGAVKWDVVNATQIMIYVGCAEGLFEKVDWAKAGVDVAAFSEPVSDCAVPIINSSGTLTYDADRFANDEGPKTWQDFWDIKKFPGKRGLWYGPQETLAVALMADGVPPTQVNDVLAGPGGVDRAFAKLDEIKPHIQWWKSGSESMQLLASGEVAMTYAWNGRVVAANRADNKNFRIAWQAGHVNGSNAFAILKGTKNKDAAIQFIAFASQPENQAAFAKIIGYGPPNSKALDLIDEETKKLLPSLYYDTASRELGEVYAKFWIENSDRLTERFATWVAK